MDRKHIYRNFDASRTNRIRYDKDNFRVSIKKFDKSNETIYKATNPSSFTTNGSKTTICGFTCYQKATTKTTDNLTLSFKFKPVEKGYYRIEMLYANLRALAPDELSAKSNYTISGSCKITNATLTKSGIWAGIDVVHNRHYDYFEVSNNQVGKTVNINYSLSPNTCFIALVIKHYEIWQGDRYNNEGHDLTITKASITKTNDLNADELHLELMYNHELDESQVIGSNTANLSGYLFDYRDEINFYITDTSGVEQQVFGGYISTISVDEDLTTMSIDAISRLNDLDHRYNITEISMNTAQTDDIDYSSCYDYYRNFTDWKYPLSYLCHVTELPLRYNINQGSSSQTKELTLKYGKTYYNKFTTSNMLTYLHNNSVTLRNGKKTNVTQSVRIFDDKIANEENKIIMSNNAYQNIRINYGLGAAKWSAVVKDSDDDKSSSADTGTISTNVDKQAKNITSLVGSASGGTAANDITICKKIVKWVGKNISYVYYNNFNRVPKTVLTKKAGNCCDQTRLVLTMCLSRGVPNTKLWYRHPSGHVLCTLCGTISDPCHSPYWDTYIPTYGKGSNVCHPPKLPF